MAKKKEKKVEKGSFVVSLGNAFDGVALFGPFDSAESAADYAEATFDDEWHLVHLNPAKEEDRYISPFKS